MEIVEKISKTKMECSAIEHISKLFTKGLAGVYAMEMIADFIEYLKSDNEEWILNKYKDIMSIKVGDIDLINGVKN